MFDSGSPASGCVAGKTLEAQPRGPCSLTQPEVPRKWPSEVSLPPHSEVARPRPFWEITGTTPRTRSRPASPGSPTALGPISRGSKPKVWGQSQRQGICGGTGSFAGGQKPNKSSRMFALANLVFETRKKIDADPQFLASLESGMEVGWDLAPWVLGPDPAATRPPGLLLSFMLPRWQLNFWLFPNAAVLSDSGLAAGSLRRCLLTFSVFTDGSLGLPQHLAGGGLGQQGVSPPHANSAGRRQV